MYLYIIRFVKSLKFLSTALLGGYFFSKADLPNKVNQSMKKTFIWRIYDVSIQDPKKLNN